ncbi:tyrosine-type recombinase/integrase [bacterium]|nr:tyrosine-type recombinase/integrase [bacterium]MDB4304711.1 tyrosine-type recombinase/integrase [Akkermansiaceae bacterium]MDB4779198.1 tyrosine-type recombinase/integrase [bacterium]
MLKSTCPYFFVGRKRNDRMTVTALQRLFQKVQKASGIRLYPHKLRHSFATMMLNRGIVTIYELKELMGHSSISSTLIYLHICNTSIKKQIAKDGLQV